MKKNGLSKADILYFDKKACIIFVLTAMMGIFFAVIDILLAYQ